MQARFLGERGVVIRFSYPTIYLKKENYDQAILDFTKAIQINPKDYIAYNNRGLSYELKEDYIRALADFNKAILLNPKYERAYRGRARVYEKTGKKTLANADRKKADELKQQ